MSLRACVCVAVLIATLPVQRTRGAAQGVAIEHKGIGCVVADRYPVVEASFQPADAVVRGRVYFRALSTPHWYYVEMRPQGASFYGTLPKPLKSTRKIEYYIEAADRSLNEARTAEFSPDVVPDKGGCGKNVVVAGMLGSAKLAVGSVAGAPAAPLGFSGVGLLGGSVAGAAAGATGAATGGGLSTGAIVGIVAGAGAVAAGVAVASGGGSSTAPSQPGGTAPASAPTPAPTPTPTPAATPTPAPTPTPPTTTTMPACPACYAGNWQLTATLVARGNPPVCSNREQIVVTFTVNANGTFSLQTDCSPPGTISAAGIVSFTLAGDTCPGTPPGRTCPAGGGTGTCSSTSSCSGTISQGGEQLTWVMRRLSP